MDNWREEVAIVQAQLAAQQMALRALIQSHPEPAALLQHWRELRADGGAAGCALPAGIRASEWLTQQIQAFAEDWTAELVDAVTRHADRQDLSSSGVDSTMPEGTRDSPSSKD